MRKTIIAGLIISIMLGLTGCGSSDDNEYSNTLTSEEYSYLNGMEDGKLYVLHKDNTYDATVFNNATFDYADSAGVTSTKRVMWFKKDFEDIPTFYEGQDRLVLYTTSTVDEEITLERFKDLGISVGLCGMKAHESGKYSVSTDPDDNNTYPESDADEVLNFTNESVIVDAIQGKPLRTEESLKLNEEKNISYEQAKNVTEYGTITNLQPNNYYDVDFYEGTKKTTIKLYSDVHIMGSCTVFKKLNYHFTEDSLQEFELPPGIHTGYYTINSLGMFRYIATGDSYTTTTNYNIGIEEENDTSLKTEEDEKEETKYAEPEPNKVIYGENNVQDEIERIADEALEAEREKEGTGEDVTEDAYEIEAEQTYLRFLITLDGEDEAKLRASATVTTPEGVAIEMSRISSTGALYADIYVESSGQYKITMHNMTNLSPSTQVMAIGEEEVREGDL